MTILALFAILKRRFHVWKTIIDQPVFLQWLANNKRKEQICFPRHANISGSRPSPSSHFRKKCEKNMNLWRLYTKYLIINVCEVNPFD